LWRGGRFWCLSEFLLLSCFLLLLQLQLQLQPYDFFGERKKADAIRVCVTYRHGKQGILNTASKQQLENEFGTTNEDEIVKKILTSGDVQSSEVRFTPLPFPSPFAVVYVGYYTWLVGVRREMAKLTGRRRTPSALASPTTPRVPWLATKRDGTSTSSSI
jgi:hypothetical protein